MKLYLPNLSYEPAFINMAMAYKAAEEDRYQFFFDEDFNYENYIKTLDDHSKGINLKDGRIQQTTFWLMADDEIYGVCRLRHYLGEDNILEGGHIGYDIVPSKRRKGYGTTILTLALEKARALKLEKVLVTCDEDNQASNKIIKSKGGVLENIIVSPDSRKNVCRYWIDL